jgi:eukaryotic-like serine/threonine-protein kinase
VPVAADDGRDDSRVRPGTTPCAGDRFAGGWDRVKAVFLAAVDQPDLERAAFLDATCAGNPALRREVEELLASDRAAGSFCERPAASLLGDSARLSPGTRLGPYTIEALIGAGGMGEVYRARDSRLGRDIAIKMLSPDVADDSERLRRFESEARAAAALNHPNIISVYDVGREHDTSYLVTELLEGRTLRAVIDAGAVPLPRALDYAVQIAQGLAAAHARNIVHRDLKPENVFVTTDGRVKVLDFGLAKAVEVADAAATLGTPAYATAPHVVLGTPSYMSPEQAQGRPVDSRTDIFSFGCLLYEMATGRRAFAGDSTIATLSLVLNHDPPPVRAVAEGVPHDLERIIELCLKKDPDRRLHSAADMKLQLEALKDESDSGIQPDAGAGSLAAPGRAGRIPRAAVLAALAVAILASAGWWLWSRPAAPSRVSSVAVLPLQGPAGNPTDDEFAEGMTDELTSSIARIAGLHVKSRSLAMKYRDSPLSFGEIASQLGVDAVIHGAVARSGNRIRIRAGMVEAGTDRQLWSDTYDQPLDDVLTLQADFARAIAEGLQVTLTDTDRARLAPRRKVDAEAYALYVRAMSRIAGHYSRGNLAIVASAAELLEEAIALDPDFADAHGGLALALALRAFSSAAQDRPTLEPRVRASIDRALALDPLNSHAHLADARLHWSRERGWPHAEAIRRVRRAIQLNPASETATRNLGIIYGHIGFPEEALEQLHKADVVHPMALIQIGMALQMQGKPVEALASYEAIPRAVRSPLALLLMTSALVALDPRPEFTCVDM